MKTGKFEPGDWVVYRKTKHSEQPGPRASNVAPARHGEGYTYTIDKYWVVRDVLPDGQLLIRTRRGKEHVVSPNDPVLRRANLLQRLLHRARFTAIEQQEVGRPTSHGEPSPNVGAA